MRTSAATAILGFSALVSAHGYVQQIWLGENLVDAWNPYKDPQKTGVNKITRKFKDNGPVTDGLFTVSNRLGFYARCGPALTSTDRCYHLQHWY